MRPADRQVRQRQSPWGIIEGSAADAARQANVVIVDDGFALRAGFGSSGHERHPSGRLSERRVRENLAKSPDGHKGVLAPGKGIGIALED